MMETNTPALPYPVLDAGSLRCHSTAILRRLYLPLRDEMVAISDALYRAIITERQFPQLSALFYRIADEELLHYRLLGRAITLLGGNPTLRVSLHPEAHHLTADDARPEGLRRLLEAAIMEKESAAMQYDRLAALPIENILPVLFLRLAADEASHKQMLCAMLEEL